LSDTFIDFEKYLAGLSGSEGFFSKSFVEARARWVEAVAKLGAEVRSVRMGDNSGHFLDYARLGSPEASTVILHIAGTHGVEGYLGAAVQLAALELSNKISNDISIIFIFCLNPWGMKNFRRTNEDNIDLNRNFRVDGFKSATQNNLYAHIDGFINPKRKPCYLEPFLPQVIWQIIRRGYSNLKQGIAGGQYEFPEGIYYGGQHISPNIRALTEILNKEIQTNQRVFGIEVHSGLGPFCYDTLFGQMYGSWINTDKFAERISHEISGEDPRESVGFRSEGDVANGVRSFLGADRTAWILQEFGTYSNIRGLKVLRNENMNHFYGSDSLDHWSKRALMEFFNPRSARWRRYVLGRGLRLLDSVVDFVRND